VTSCTLRAASLSLAAATLFGCSRQATHAGGPGATPPPLPADVQAVASVASPSPTPPDTRGDESRLALTGEFVPLVRSNLVPRTGGRVARVLADEGQPVRRGQPLLELETDYLKLDLARAEAELRRAEAAAQDAGRDFERKKGLAQKGSVAQATFDRSQSGAEQADAARQAAATALDLARQRLADATLTSPVDGVIAERRTDVGERLTEGTVAFVVEQTAPLKLRFRAPERYVARVRQGQEVRAAVDAFPEQGFEGQVSLVGGAVDPQTRTFLVEAEFPNRDHRLRPGQFARVELDLVAR